MAKGQSPEQPSAQRCSVTSWLRNLGQQDVRPDAHRRQNSANPRQPGAQQLQAATGLPRAAGWGGAARKRRKTVSTRRRRAHGVPGTRRWGGAQQGGRAPRADAQQRRRHRRAHARARAEHASGPAAQRATQRGTGSMTQARRALGADNVLLWSMVYSESAGETGGRRI